MANAYFTQNSISKKPDEIFLVKPIFYGPRNFSFMGSHVAVFLNDSQLNTFKQNVAAYHNDIEKGLTRKAFAGEKLEFFWIKEVKSRGAEKRYMVKTYRGLAKRLVRLAGFRNEALEYLPLDTMIGIAKEAKTLEAPKLRDYQIEAVEKALLQMAEIGAATIQAPTGSGKTEIAVAIAKLLLGKVVRKVFFLAHTKDLIRQARDRFKKYGVDAGIVDGENFEVEKEVVAVTVQTLYKALTTVFPEKFKNGNGNGSEVVQLPTEKQRKLVEEYMKAGLVIVDECHHVPAKTVFMVTLANEWSLRLGLSATPYRNDYRELLIYGAVGDIAYKIESEMLIEKGYIMRPKVYMVERKLKYQPHINSLISYYIKLAKEAKDDEKKRNKYYLRAWNQIEKAIYSDEMRLFDIVALMVRKLPTPALILIGRVELARKLADMLNKNGFYAEAVVGEMKGEERKRIIEELKDGKLNVIVGTQLADEGLDLPNIRSLVIAIPGKSVTRFPQRIGRVMRKFQGKKEAIVVDLVDVPSPGWHPYVEKKLAEHAKQREEMYRKLGAEVERVEIFQFLYQ